MTEFTNKPGKKGLARIVDAFGYSCTGLKQAWDNEAAFREEACLLVVFIPLAFWLGSTVTEVALLLMSCFIVLITELLNSAIEAVVDRVGAERHALSGRAKDIASAAVLVSLLQVLVVWGLIIWQRFFS
ncbi:MAG: diacylglycerol kinase [Pseudomonadales bacterium]|nr:diacylglycerol kinase [Pseudomonadales bacterium]